MTTATTTEHGAVTREDITDVINGQPAHAAAPVSPADHGMLDTARDMVSYVHATHELRRDADGQPYAVHRQTGEVRRLQGDRRSRSSHGTLREWLISERVMHSRNGQPPSNSALSAIMATLEQHAKTAPQDHPAPDQYDGEPNGREELTDGHVGFRAGVPAIRVDTLPVAVRALLSALGSGRVPDLYTRGGALVWLEETKDADLATKPLSPGELVTHLEDYIDFWQTDDKGDEKPVLCPESVASRIVNRREHRLPVLERIVTTPVLLPDGRLLQTPGYDAATGIYYHPRHEQLPRVPDRPDAALVAKSKRFLLDVILGDFPWETGENGFDRANYVAGLVTPILSSMLQSNVPMFLVSAPERGSGKSLLTEIVGAVYGAADMPHEADPTELKKQITTKLLETTEPVVVVDNVPNGHYLGNHVWATLLTKRRWEDRILGSTKQVCLTQDRVWWASGNNIGVADDMWTRHYPVRIDPQQPNPEQRSGWRSEEVTGPGVYLGNWLAGEGGQEPNAWRVLYALLVLVMDWVAAGMPEADIVNRSFTAWARRVGGFLAHHGIGEVGRPPAEEANDENADRWSAFYTAWWGRFGSDPVTVRELRDALGEHEAWPADSKGWAYTNDELGKALRSAKGQFYAGLAPYRHATGAAGTVARWTLRKAK